MTYRLLLLSCLFVGCHPVTGRVWDPPDEDLIDVVRIQMTVGEEVFVDRAWLNPHESLFQLDPKDSGHCWRSFYYQLDTNDPDLITVHLLAPRPFAAGLSFPVGSAFIEGREERDGTWNRVRATGGTATVEHWTPELRQIAVRGGELCVGERGGELECRRAPPVVLTITVDPDDSSYMPGAGDNCWIGLEPWPEWDADPIGPCAWYEEPCPE